MQQRELNWPADTFNSIHLKNPCRTFWTPFSACHQGHLPLRGLLPTWTPLNLKLLAFIVFSCFEYYNYKIQDASAPWNQSFHFGPYQTDEISAQQKLPPEIYMLICHLCDDWIVHGNCTRSLHIWHLAEITIEFLIFDTLRVDNTEEYMVSILSWNNKINGLKGQSSISAKSTKSNLDRR